MYLRSRKSPKAVTKKPKVSKASSNKESFFFSTMV